MMMRSMVLCRKLYVIGNLPDKSIFSSFFSDCIRRDEKSIPSKHCIGLSSQVPKFEITHPRGCFTLLFSRL